MQILLLAAGMGTRLAQQAAALPKSLIPVQGKPLLVRILDCLKEFSITRVVVVTGFERGKMEQVLSDYPIAVSVLNPDFKKGNLLSVLSGRGKVSSPFAVFNADHFYSKEIYRKILGYRGSSITAVCDFDRPLGDDDMKMKLSPQRTLASLSKKMEKPDCGYVGVTLIPSSLEKKYWEAAEAVLKESGEGAHAEMVLNELASRGEKINILDISGSSWIEVDTPEDLALAEKRIGLIDGD
ncbi:MAG: NTP transferase domain-containing protein [Deltaproteobacteria bacterium]|nr:NTP transferase domain-containing protein [Deltaproteobacteria bacterium]